MSRTLDCQKDGRKTLRRTADGARNSCEFLGDRGQVIEDHTELPHNSRRGLLLGNAQVTRSTAVQCIHCHSLASASPAVPSPFSFARPSATARVLFRCSNLPPSV